MVGDALSLSSLPTIGFSTIYHHFVERSVLVSARQSLGSVSASSADSEIFDSAKGIDKGFQFFKDGHVQKIEASFSKNRTYVRCNVLLSMKKDTVYKCRICMGTDAIVKVALCTCTAGLGGVCNHIAALLYALEEFVRLGLREEDDTSPTSQLCKWNRPRPRRTNASSTLLN